MQRAVSAAALIYRRVFDILQRSEKPRRGYGIPPSGLRSCLFIRIWDAVRVGQPTSVRRRGLKKDGRDMRARQVVMMGWSEHRYAAVGRTTRLILSIV